MSEDRAVNVLWTGGWDSSFRVLDLCLVQGRTVQPHYIVDLNRKSSLHELRAIARMKAILADQSPEAHRRILPHNIVSTADIRPDPTISRKLATLRSRNPLGKQYDWICRFAHQLELDGLELSVHKDDRVEVFLRDSVERTPDGDSWQLADDADDDMQIFSVFRFPILQMTKEAMLDQARDGGFLDILEQSWFCHAPIRDAACGFCHPCVFAIDEGMGHRLSTLAHMRYRARYVYKATYLLTHPRELRATLQDRTSRSAQ